MPVLPPTVRAVLTALAVATTALAATGHSETVRIVAGVILTTSASLGIVPPHVETK